MRETCYSLCERSAVKRKTSPEPEPVSRKQKRQKRLRKKAVKAESLVKSEDQVPEPVKSKKRSKAPSSAAKEELHNVELEPDQSTKRQSHARILDDVEILSVKESVTAVEGQPFQHRVSTPAEQVFNTAELLEMILLRVPDADDSVISAVAMKTILLSQRVNKFFQATIEGSAKLERLLWLLPPDNHGTGHQFRLNPMLRANLRRGDMKPFAEASTALRSGGSCVKIICTEQGLFGPGCESAKAMLLAKSARSPYTCEVTFKPPPGVDVPALPDFVLDLTRNATVGDLEDAVFQCMETYVHVSGKQSAKKNALAFKWTLPLRRAETLRATTGR